MMCRRRTQGRRRRSRPIRSPVNLGSGLAISPLAQLPNPIDSIAMGPGTTLPSFFLYTVNTVPPGLLITDEVHEADVADGVGRAAGVAIRPATQPGASGRRVPTVTSRTLGGEAPNAPLVTSAKGHREAANRAACPHGRPGARRLLF